MILGGTLWGALVTLLALTWRDGNTRLDSVRASNAQLRETIEQIRAKTAGTRQQLADGTGVARELAASATSEHEGAKTCGLALSRAQAQMNRKFPWLARSRFFDCDDVASGGGE